MANKLHPLSAPRAGFAWGANAREIDMATAPAKPVPLKIAAAPQNITIDLKRTAMIVIDMQNDFCAKGGWVDYLGADYTPDRKPIKPLQKLLPALRKAGMPVIWVNWGNRPDLANMPPNQIHLYKPAGTGVGPGRPAARQRRAGAAEGFRGRRRSSTSSSRSPRTSRSTSIASRASGTRRSIRSCATSARARCCSPASTPTSAFCIR